ncbi:MAG: segregation/condensation protein A [Gaiellaceae bacterium]|jgi:segregation and condensation protein A
MRVAELELDLEAFEGPLDLLLTLVLKEEIDLAEVDVAGIVLAFVETMFEPAPARDTTAERELGEGDLEACGEFLVLVSALLELKARLLFDEEAAELAELEPEEAAEELTRRLVEYRRMKEAAGWLVSRLERERDRYFRIGPAPLQPAPERPLDAHDPATLAASLRALAVPPKAVSLAHMSLRYPPLEQFVQRFRSLLVRRSRFDFEDELGSLSRVEQAIAFLALLELGRLGEIAINQAAPFAPIRVERRMRERGPAWTNARSA